MRLPLRIGITVALFGGCGAFAGQGSSDLSAQRQGSAAPLQQVAGTGSCLKQNGLAYSPFRDGQTPIKPVVFPRREQIEEDLAFLSRVTTRIRTYRASGVFSDIPALAKKVGIRIAQGIHLGPDKGVNDSEIAAGVALARAGLVDMLIVGNENLTAKTLSKAELLQYIALVRKDAPKEVPVATAEVWPVWADHPDLMRAVDVVIAHFYPFWEGHPIQGAAEQLANEYATLQVKLAAVRPGRPVPIVIGETGWPSAGTPLKSGVEPGPSNQKKFFDEFMAFACPRAIPFYYFSAFDEEWKWDEGASSGPAVRTLPRDRTFSGRWIGSSWGLFESNGTRKPQFQHAVEQPAEGSRRDREIFYDGQLSAHYDIGVDTSHNQRNWLKTPGESLGLFYPARQDWGAVFFTVGAPTPGSHPWKDFSGFTLLSFELRGHTGDEAVEIGVKDYADASEGKGRKFLIRNPGTTFRTYDVPLTRFESSWLVLPDDLARLHVVVEFVFTGPKAQTVYVRNIRYKAAKR